MMDEGKKKKVKVLSLLGIGLLVLLGVSYSLTRLTLTGNKNILMTVGNVTLALTDDSTNVIEISGGIPLSEAEGEIQLLVGYISHKIFGF